MQSYDRSVMERLAADDVVLVSGYARLPGGVASHSQFEQLGVVLAVGQADGRIVAADTTLLTGLARDFFRAVVEGCSARDEPENIVARLQRRYHGQSGAALVTATKRALEAYAQLGEEQESDE